MPSASLKKYLEELIASKQDKFEDNFDIEWNLFSTLCLIRSEGCLDKKTDPEKLLFRDSFMNLCKTKSEKMNFLLKDKHFKESLNDLFQNLIQDSGISRENQKSSAVARFFFDAAKRKIEQSWEKALIKYNMALHYCPYSKDATSQSDTLLYTKILLKRSELFCLNLNVQDGLLDIEEAFDLLKDIKGEERNLLYCKFLYAKSVFLDLLDYKEYEHQMCSSLIEETVEEFKFNSYLMEKLRNYQEFLNQVFVANKELIKSEFNRKEQPVTVNILKANPKMPGASTSVEMCLIKGKGRCTRAAAPIREGSMLFVEKPIVTWMRPTMNKFYCNHCFVKIKNHFITCFNCNKIKYCSGKCRDEAYQNYHSVECKFQESLRYLGYGQMVLRTMMIFDQDQMMNLLANDEKSTKQSQEGIDETKVTSAESTSSASSNEDELKANVLKGLSPRSKLENTHFLDNDHWVENGFPSELDYQSFFSLYGDEKHLNFFQMISFCYGVALLGMFARKMKIIDKEDRFYYIFHAGLLSHIQKINFNCYSINDHSLKVDRKHNFWMHTNDSNRIGIAVYQSSSIISHSCDHNSNRLSLGSKIVIYTNRLIKKGEEITNTYGPSHKIASFKDRQSLLSNGYLFNCKCDPCERKQENIQNAFRCSICKIGPLIWNADYTNECLKCKVKDQDLNIFVSKLSLSEEQFAQINEHLKNGQWSECKQLLDQCKKTLKSIFFSEQKLDNLYRTYMEFYVQRKKFKNAAKYAIILAKLQKTKDEGKETLESVLYSLKAVSLFIMHLKNTSTFPNFQQHLTKRNINKVKDEYSKILDIYNRINSRQVKLLESSYLAYLDCFEHVDTFLQSVNVEM